MSQVLRKLFLGKKGLCPAGGMPSPQGSASELELAWHEEAWVPSPPASLCLMSPEHHFPDSVAQGHLRKLYFPLSELL